MEIKNQIILVTGSTGNIGPKITDGLSEKGAKVIGTYWSEENRKMAEKRSEKEIKYLKADLTKPEDVENLRKEIEEEEGRLTSVVNLVGGFSPGGLKETDALKLKKSFNTHTLTVFLMAKKFSEHLEKNRGSMINFTSQRALSPTSGALAYNVGKGSVKILTEALNEEFEKARVNAIAPLTIDTPSNRKAMPDANFDDWTDPEEILHTVEYLLENEAVNGQTINI